MSRTFELLDLSGPRTPALLYDPGSYASSSHVTLAWMIFLQNQSMLTDLLCYRLCEYINFKTGSMSVGKFSSVSRLIFTTLSCSGREQYYFLEGRSLNEE